MTEHDGSQQRVTTYEYDENDRLTRQFSDGPPLTYRWPGEGGAAYAEAPPKPSKYAGYGLTAYIFVSLAILLLPLRLLWPRRPGVGRRIRRKGTWVRTVALALIPLMVIGPEAVLALHHEASLYQTMAAATVGQVASEEILYELSKKPTPPADLGRLPADLK